MHVSYCIVLSLSPFVRRSKSTCCKDELMPRFSSFINRRKGIILANYSVARSHLYQERVENSKGLKNRGETFAVSASRPRIEFFPKLPSGSFRKTRVAHLTKYCIDTFSSCNGFLVYYVKRVYSMNGMILLNFFPLSGTLCALSLNFITRLEKSVYIT